MKLRQKTGALLYVGALVLAGAQVARAQEPRPMTIVDLINVPSVSDPQLSPKGSQLLYVRSDADWKKNNSVPRIWRVNADGSDAVQLTSGPEGESNPRWSPDGSRIAFLTKRGEAKETQIYLLRNDGGEAQQLTRHATSVSDLSWSPDGQWIYFVAADDKTPEEKAREKINDNVFAFDEDWKQRHLWRVSVDGAAKERITEGDFTVRGYQLSRDGRLIAHHRAPTPLLDDGQGSEVWVMSATGADARQLTRENTIAESGAELSPDNSQLLFVANSNQEFDFYYNSKLFLIPVSGGRPTLLLPDLPHEVNGASWSADGRSIFVLANTGVRQELFQVEVASRRVTQLTRGDHTVSS